ncbi:MAG: ATP synthase F1 subunit epsilon [Candidatus Pacebacteria bacterium]|nr:ATP synthase F1 subunit epsilon [Candidatus Paceibacterota bacterium]MCF7863119.1 ATP synthase F1 subunit epsilon [Candidatus Paceibacterota bacterium]
MAKKLKLKIVTPEKMLLEEEVEQVSLPATTGEITILPDHIPLVANLSSGDVVALSNGEYVPLAVVGGFVEVKKNEGITEVAVLADFAEHISELDENMVQQARDRAEEIRAKMINKEDINYEHFASELERSLTRVKIADKWRLKKYRK